MVGFLGETETSSNALIAGGSPQSSSVGFLEDTGSEPDLDSLLGVHLNTFESLASKAGILTDKLVEPLTQVRKRANLDDLWDALVYATTAFTVEGVAPFNIKFPDNAFQILKQLWDIVKQVGSVVLSALGSLKISDVLFILAIGIPLLERFGIKILKGDVISLDKEKVDLRLRFIEEELKIGSKDHDKWIKSVAGQRKASKAAEGFYAKLGKKIGGNLGNAVKVGGPWYVAYRLAKLLLDAFEGSIYYAMHKFGEPAADITDEEKGARLGTHRSQPSITAWYGKDGIIRFYDKNDQEVRITTPDPWEFIIPDKGINPADYKRNGGLISGYRPMGDHRNNLIAV